MACVLVSTRPLAWLKEASPDILCLQEIKMRGRGLSARGLRGPWLQHRNPRPEGLQRRRPSLEAAAEDVSRGLPGDADRTHARFIEASVSVPSGAAPRRVDLPAQRQSDRHREVRLQARLDGAARGTYALAVSPQEETFVFAGDYNVIPEPDDARIPGPLGRRCAVPARKPQPRFAATSISA